MKKERRINELLRNMYYPEDNIYHTEPNILNKYIERIKNIFKETGKFFTKRKYKNTYKVHREECGVMNRPWVD